MTQARDGERRYQARFATTFVRGLGYRFEFQGVRGYLGAQGRLELASRHSRTFLWTPASGYRALPSVNDGLVMLTGFTHGAVNVVASLMLPNAVVDPIPSVESCTRRDADRVLDGDDCYQFRCGGGEDADVVFIRKRDLALVGLEGVERYAGPRRFEGAPSEFALDPAPLPGDLETRWSVRLRPMLDGPVAPTELDLLEESEAVPSTQ